MMGCGLFLLSVCFLLCSQGAPYAASHDQAENDEGHFINEFIVEVSGDSAVADLVAESNNFRMLSQIRGLGNVFRFQHSETEKRSKRSADDVAARLMRDPNVKHVIQERILRRDKREIIHDKQMELPIQTYEDKSVYQRFYHEDNRVVAKDHIPDGKRVSFRDPFFRDQWYLVNTGQSGGPEGLDVNVMPVWRNGITGKDVVLCILDDGIDHTHKDLAQNYDPKASKDLNDKDDVKNDPMPNVNKAGNSHGTRCAGEVAAEADNDVCGVGVAYNAKIGGVRMLDGAVTDGLEAEALLFNNNYIHIYSASWGPRDNGKTMEGPGTYASKALEKGIKNGRNGLGSIFVWATGNGGMNHDSCSCDGYVSSIYTLSVGCIDDVGQSTYFSEVCPSTMAVVYTGGSHLPPSKERSLRPKLKVVTTDLNNGCTLGFEGTSSAAPLAAGIFALVLEANKNLTWRDLQHIVVETAKVTNNETGWVINGAGRHVNHKFGFGALDAGKMVEMAQHWQRVPEQHTCHVPTIKPFKPFGSRSSVNVTITTDGCKDNKTGHVDKLEHTEIHVKLKHSRRGDVQLFLVSPSGTRSRILQVRQNDDNDKGIDFTFMTVFNWGENPTGKWVLEVTDKPRAGHSTQNIGVVESVSLILYGTASLPREKKTGGMKKTAFNPDDRTIKHILNKEQQESKAVKIKTGSEPNTENPVLKHQTTEPVSLDADTDANAADVDARRVSDKDIAFLYDALQQRLSQLDHRHQQQLLHARNSHIAKKNEIPSEADREEPQNVVDYRDLISALLNADDKETHNPATPDANKRSQTDTYKRGRASSQHEEHKRGRAAAAAFTDAEINTLLDLAEVLESTSHDETAQRIREVVKNARK